MKTIMTRVSAVGAGVRVKSIALWKQFRARKPWQQITAAVLLGVLVIGGISFIHGLGKTKAAEEALRTVSLASIGSLSGAADGGSVIGSVRSIAEADILAESGGTVRVVRTELGASVGGGGVIAELENASQRAAVLQAEGAYDAAIAARNSVSPSDSALTVRNTYRSAFTTLDSLAKTEIDSFFGEETPFGPRSLITSTTYSADYFSKKRSELKRRLDTWSSNQATAGSRDPQELLTEAQSNLDFTASFLAELATAANSDRSGATTAQLTNVSSARASVNLQISALASARESYRGKSVSSTASVDASVKQALGVLRGAQAQLEKTIVRAPIAGTINFLPIRVGDYVTAYQHVATVAQNGSLEVVGYISETEREQLSVGEKVKIDGTYEGVVTRIAPALDPTTRQIELHVAVTGAADKLVNGQSVRITLPNATVTTQATTGPIMLPLAAVKLRAEDRVVFTVDEAGRIVAHAVTIGDVHGDRIEVVSGVTMDMRIVTDARGLAEGQKVTVGDSSASL